MLADLAPESPGVAAPVPEPTAEDVVGLVQRVLTEELDLPGTVTEASRLVEELQLDSVGLTVVAVHLENRYRVKLNEADAIGVQTVGDLVALLRKRLAEAP